jgi:hypothetical protein
MKDNRFIELLNLYIDRQITGAEAAELEAEMQAHPRRRAVYHQYCQLHRATKLVYDGFRSAAVPQGEPGSGAANVAGFSRRQNHRRVRWMAYAGGLAAACLAMVFLRSSPSQPGTSSSSVTLPSAPLALATVARPVSAPSKAAGNLADLRNSLPAEQDYAAMLAAIRHEELRAFASGQVPANRPASLFEDGVFDSTATSPLSTQRIFRGRQTPAQQAEFTAFQFQR